MHCLWPPDLCVCICPHRSDHTRSCGRPLRTTSIYNLYMLQEQFSSPFKYIKFVWWLFHNKTSTITNIQYSRLIFFHPAAFQISRHWNCVKMLWSFFRLRWRLLASYECSISAATPSMNWFVFFLFIDMCSIDISMALWRRGCRVGPKIEIELASWIDLETVEIVGYQIKLNRF